MKTNKLKILLLLATSLLPLVSGAKEIALSFDDAPKRSSIFLSGTSRTEKLLQKLKKSNVPEVVFFCNSKRLSIDNGINRLKMYADAGHIIANHTHSHPNANKIPVDDFINEIIRADTELREYKTFKPWFRFPYLRRHSDLNSNARLKSFMTQFGYTDGYVTVDNGDWYMNKLFVDAFTAGEKINFDKLKQLYVRVLMDEVKYYDEMAIEWLGHSPRHVLLLHENDLAAMYVDDLISALRNEGWEIISATEAYKKLIGGNFKYYGYASNGRIGAMANALGMDKKLTVNYSQDKKVLDKLFDKQVLNK